jgi:hypothetical protein
MTVCTVNNLPAAWRGGCRSDISVPAPFVWRCLSGSTVTPFPHPAHRTGHADLPHPALGQDLTPFLVYMLPPLPRRSVWAYCFAQSPSRISLRGAFLRSYRFVTGPDPVITCSNSHCAPAVLRYSLDCGP